MADDSTPMRPQDQTNFLLGELSGKMTALQGSVDSNATTQAEINAGFRAGIDKAQSTADAANSKAALVEARIPAKTPWTQVASGWAAIGAIVLAGIALLRVVFP